MSSFVGSREISWQDYRIAGTVSPCSTLCSWQPGSFLLRSWRPTPSAVREERAVAAGSGAAERDLGGGIGAQRHQDTTGRCVSLARRRWKQQFTWHCGDNWQEETLDMERWADSRAAWLTGRQRWQKE
ncbi:unnamed protein product [Prorocentrum cordatum]|uniref:Uncharacterized protein n=1 Tax=Prorocentrum cordatum TaxID=2364126 RepID=A0ABN9TG62_9DINO|nr:unnamed protein product [Polarella glacialis]